MKTDHDNMPTQFLNVLRLISVNEIDVLKLKIAEYFAFAISSWQNYLYISWLQGMRTVWIWQNNMTQSVKIFQRNKT